ncbi:MULTISPECIES: PRC-barrel domain-containing protein [unclassified Chelatococcus]|uniref:PRC-barrel domain-containing protein n=1 Tax=unclassified Chelatococcus TaxID=2638111 RepID=UPI001BD009AE|nr:MULTISPECIES: PRC-barrel domain-containing protein [unclassified Chelatococcus]MBS7698412.1 PRC-barrel domain-containing protein [Chelatococcus sp. YT9]MBX3558821.1 PRC-barrel domain-containing protein [Chelatococcus sp.]
MMMKRVTLATALLAAVAAGPALAQNATNPSTTAPGSNPPAAAPAAPMVPNATTSAPAAPGAGAVTYISQQTDNQLLGSKLIGASVVGNEDASIGEIEDLLIAKTGAVEGVVVGVGGFLGLGQKNVAVPMTALQMTPDGNAANTPKIMIRVSKADLQNAPEFKRADDNTDTMTTGSTRPATPAAPGGPAAPGAPAAPAR